MYSKVLSFDEKRFFEILENETKIAQQEKANVFTFNTSVINKVSILVPVKRSINYIYNHAIQSLTPRPVPLKASFYHGFAMPESVAAHCDIMMAIYDCIKDFLPRHSFRCSRNVFELAIRHHDMPENVFVGNPDNHYHDFEKVDRDLDEAEFFYRFDQFVPNWLVDDYKKAQDLLSEAYKQATPEGRLFFLCDKLATIICPLTSYFDYKTEISNKNRREPVVVPPVFFSFSDTFKPTQHEKEVLKVIRNNCCPSQSIPAHEFYAGDYLKVSNYTRYDDYGIFIDILIAYTLATTDWYLWRENAYRSIE